MRNHQHPSTKGIFVQRTSNHDQDYFMGWCITFPLISGILKCSDSKAIMPTKSYKTFSQAHRVAIRWQKRLEKLAGHRIPLFMNDTRYSWGDSPKQELRYRSLG